MNDMISMDAVRNSPGYLRERARLGAELDQACAVVRDSPDGSARIAAWCEFGKHGALWQLFHRKPS